MKKFYLLIIIAFVMTGCGGYPESPEEVAMAYYDAYENADFEAVKNYLTGTAYERFNTWLERTGEEAAVKKTEDEIETLDGIESVTVLSSDVEPGEKAVLDMEILFGNGVKQNTTLTFKKTDAKWRIEYLE